LATNRISVLVALDGADDGLKRTLQSAERSLNDLAVSAKTAGQKAAAGLAEVKAGMSAFGEQIERAKGQLLAFVGIQWAVGKAREVIQIADAWNQLNARLKLATLGQQEFAAAQKAVFEIAQRVGVPVESTAILYGKLAQAVRMLGGEQKEALELTEMVSQGLRLSGASAQQSEAALLQLGQALSAGVLRGEEFNSVIENSPRLAQALADGLNVPIGRLRKMAEEGRLTADVVTRAWLSQKDRIAAEFAQLPQTFDQSMEKVRNAFMKVVGTFDESTGATRRLADGMTWLAQHMDAVVAAFKVLAEVGLAVLAYRLLPALVTGWQTVQAAAMAAAASTSAAWATANLSIQGVVASVGALRAAFALLAAFFVGWEIGTWLSEHFALVRKAGIFMVQALLVGVEQLRFQWEAFAAIFTSDTVAKAAERHAQRLNEILRITSEMADEAGRSGEATKTAMNSAAAAAEETARRLEAVRLGTQEAAGRGVEAVHAGLEKLKIRLGEVEQQVSKARGTVDDATAKMAEAYKGLTAQVEQAAQQQSAAVRRRYEQELAALETSRQSQESVLSKSTQLLVDAMAQQAVLRQRATSDTLRLIDQEGAARIEAARRQGQSDAERAANVKRVESEILATKRTTLDQALQEYRQHIDALNGEANRHLKEIKRIEEEKRSLALSTADRVREIQRQGMSDFEATEDRKRQVSELQAKAREALNRGEFDQARQFAKQAMDLAAEVANQQTQEAKRGQEARKQAEGEQTRVVELEAQARDAARRGETEQAQNYLKQAAQLQADLTQKMKVADAEASHGKDGSIEAIQRMKEAQGLLNQALDAEGRAHKDAAANAVAARGQIEQVLAHTQAQLDDVTAKLKQGLTLTIDADTWRFAQALEELDKALAEKQRLLVIQADLQQAQKALQDYEQQLKDGKVVTLGADTTKARAALSDLQAYAKDKGEIELRVATEKAQAAIANVDSQVRALDHIKTESAHRVDSNAEAVRAQVTSLNGLNTSSTHTITVQRVEAHAVGGQVGANDGVLQLAQGGSVPSAFPRMRDGQVPGSGDADTVPRTLETGAFVLRRAAVRKYGAQLLGKLLGVAHFAAGGTVRTLAPGFSAPGFSAKTNRAVTEVQQMIVLGLSGMREYMNWLQYNYGAGLSIDAKSKTAEYWDALAQQDRRALEALQSRPKLTSRESQQIEEIKGRWRTAMAQPLTYGKDLERDLMAYMEAHQGEFYAKGGRSKSDTVPAMLTPGEYVVNRDAVSRLGVGFFEALNSLKVPAQLLAGQVQGFAAGGLVQPLAGLARALPGADLGVQLMASINSAMRTSAAAYSMATPSVPSRTIRVELAAGERSIAATVDARDESRLLEMLQRAKARSQ